MSETTLTFDDGFTTARSVLEQNHASQIHISESQDKTLARLAALFLSEDSLDRTDVSYVDSVKLAMRCAFILGAMSQ